MHCPLLNECIEEVVGWLAPQQRFAVATDLRFAFVQGTCLPVVSTIEYLCKHGHVDALKTWKRSGRSLGASLPALTKATGEAGCLETGCLSSDSTKTATAMDWASEGGHIAVLEWWKNEQLDTNDSNAWTRHAIDWASTNGHVAVLEWWKRSQLRPLVWSFMAMDWASQQGHVAVLEWWKNSGFELRYSYWANVGPSARGHVAVLDWWKNSGLAMRWYKTLARQLANQMNHMAIVEWWDEGACSPPSTPLPL